MTTAPDLTAPVRSDAHLLEHWATLLQLGGFRTPVRRTLHLMWLRPDGTPVPLLIPVDDLPLEADLVAIGNLQAVHGVIAESERLDPADLHLALCLERRGPAYETPEDASWAAAIEAIVRRSQGLDCSLHLHDGRTIVSVLRRPVWPG